MICINDEIGNSICKPGIEYIQELTRYKNLGEVWDETLFGY